MAEDKSKALEREISFLFDKTYACPCCGGKFKNKTVRTSSARLLGTERDLRPKYDGIDLLKYDVVLCPHCGYTALSRSFANFMPRNKEIIQKEITSKFHAPEEKAIITYEEAMSRYQLALACAVVCQAKPSEKAYICLKMSWILKGLLENVPEEQKTNPRVIEITKRMKAYTKNAYDGFSLSIGSEYFPICGMDEPTLDYLMAALGTEIGEYDRAKQLLGSVITASRGNRRLQDKALELKEFLLAQDSDK